MTAPDENVSEAPELLMPPEGAVLRQWFRASLVPLPEDGSILTVFDAVPIHDTALSTAGWSVNPVSFHLLTQENIYSSAEMFIRHAILTASFSESEEEMRQRLEDAITEGVERARAYRLGTSGEDVS